MAEDLISVIMPAYNVQAYISQAIESVIQQSLTNWELIIVDDGSRDNTRDRIVPFLKDKRIRLVTRENSGVSRARNCAIQRASGNWIAFLDADDRWLPDKLEIQTAVVGKYPEVGVCGTSLETIGRDGRVIHSFPSKDFFGHASRPLVAGLLSIPLSSGLVRKDLFDSAGYFDERISSYSEDYDFWLRASLICPFYRIGKVLIQYRVDIDNTSHRIGDKRRDIVLNVIIPRFLKEYGGSKYVKPHHVRRLRSSSYLNRAAEQKRLAWRLLWLFRSLGSCPWNPAVWQTFLSLLLPKRLRCMLKRVLQRK